MLFWESGTLLTWMDRYTRRWHIKKRGTQHYPRGRNVVKEARTVSKRIAHYFRRWNVNKECGTLFIRDWDSRDMIKEGALKKRVWNII